MNNARHLIEEIRRSLQPLEQEIVHHRYLDAMETRRVERDELKIFAAQQFHIISNDLRSIAHCLARHGHLPSRRYLLGLLHTENEAFEALGTFAAQLGMRDDEMATSEPLPAAFAYSAFLTWLASYGSDAELAAAFAVNFAAWGSNCKRMSHALQAEYGFPGGAVAFFDLFAGTPPADDAVFAVIQGGLERGVAPVSIRRGARLLQGYELMFWDCMAQTSSV